MLRQRVITALCLAPLAVLAIYGLGATWFAAVMAAVTGLAVLEWAALAGLSNRVWQAAYLGGWLVLAGIAWSNPGLLQGVLWVGAAVWVVALTLVLTWPASSALIGRAWFTGVLGWVVLLCAWAAAVSIHALPGGPHWLLGSLALVWSADIGAYFAGRRYGRHKLAPRVSPGKTWEGVAGGVAAAWTVCGAALAIAGLLTPVWMLLLACLTAVSVVGDLLESLLKRAAGVKDSGSLLPGHGGVLDRIDGVIAVLPFAALWLSAHARAV